MSEKDLFGNESKDEDYFINKHESSYQRFKRVNNYRKSIDNKKCKYCIYKIRFIHHSKSFYKCKLIGFSHGMATDIKAFHICNKFKGD